MKKGLSESIVDVLKEKGCSVEQLDGETTFRMGFTGRNGSFSTLIIVDDEERMLRICTHCPINVPKSKLPVTAELVVRINCNLTLGNFDLDMDDGLVFFKTSMKVGTADPDHETLDALIFGNFFIMDHYFPALASVVFGRISPKRMIQLLRDADDERDQVPEEDSGEDEPPSDKSFNGRMGFFSDN